jgi:hypothetical protein
MALLVSGFAWSTPVLAVEQFGLYDLRGKEILPCRYAEVREIGNEQFAVTPFIGGPAPKFDFAIDRMGARVNRSIPAKPSPYDASDVPYVHFSEQGSKCLRFGLKHRDGRVIIPLSENTLASVVDAGDGRYTVMECLPNSSYVYYLLDRSNIIATLLPDIEPRFYQYSCGLMAVNVLKEVPPSAAGKAGSTARAIGFIDKRGKLVVTLPENVDTEGFSDNVATYGIGNASESWSYIVDTTGRTIKCTVPNSYMGKFKNGRAVLTARNLEKLQRGLVDKQGRLLLPAINHLVEDHGGYFFIEKDNIFSVLKQDCSKVFDFPKETTSVLPCGDNGWFVFGIGGKAREFQQPNEPYAGAKYGFVDGRGVIKIPAQFDSATAFENGIAIVSKPLLGAIDESGKFLLPAEFKQVVRSRQQAIVSREFPDFKPTYPKSVADMEAQLQLAAVSPDLLALRQMQSLSYAYYANLNRVDLAARFDMLLANKVCPVCHSDKDVHPVAYGLHSITVPGQLGGGCEVSFSSPRWGCIKDGVAF